MEANTMRVRITDLVLRDDLQVRNKLDSATVRQYAATLKNDPNAMPPIVIAVLNGAPTLISGWHRVAAMKKVGISETHAKIVKVADEDAARWLAAEANLRHGLRLKPKEVREVFKAYVKAGRHRRGNSLRAPLKSYREITNELGGTISYGAVRNWMKKDFPSIFKRMGDRGGDYRGNGGEPPPVRTYQPADAAREALGDALAAWRAVTDPAERGVIIAEAEAIVQQMKEGAPWQPVPCEPAEGDDF